MTTQTLRFMFSLIELVVFFIHIDLKGCWPLFSRDYAFELSIVITVSKEMVIDSRMK